MTALDRIAAAVLRRRGLLQLLFPLAAVVWLCAWPTFAPHIFALLLACRLFLGIYWHACGYRHVPLSSSSSLADVGSLSAPPCAFHKHIARSLGAAAAVGGASIGAAIVVAWLASGTSSPHSALRVHRALGELGTAAGNSTRFQRGAFFDKMRVATASYCAVASASCVMNAEYALDDHFRADWERTNAQLVADARHAFAGRASVSPSAFNCSFAAWCIGDVGSEYRNPEAASIYRYTIAPAIAKYSSCLLNLSHAIDDRLHEFREAGAQLVSIWDDEYQHIISLNTPQLFLHHLTRSLAITYNKRGRQQKTPDDDTTLTRLIAACTPVHSAYRFLLSRPTIDERIHLLRSTLSSAHKLETLAQHCSSIATSSLADLERHKPQLDDLCSDYIDFDPLIDDLTAFFQGDRPRMPSHVKTDDDDAGTITLNLDSTAWELTWARLVNSRITTTLDQVLHDMTTRPEVWIQGQAFFRLATGLSLGDMTLQKERMDRWLEIVDPPLVTHGREGGTKRAQKK